MNTFVKTLIISNNPMSNMLNNGKTLLSLFGEYPRKYLSQVYLKKHREHQPYVDSLELSPLSCEFAVGEKIEDTSSSLREVSVKVIDRQEKSTLASINSARAKNWFTRIIRDLIYLPSIFFAAFKVKGFIKKHNVERIFWVYSDFLSLHLFLYLVKKLTNVRVDVFYTDDYLFEYTEDVEGKVPVRRGYNRLLYLSTRRMTKFFTKSFVISKKMADLYNRELNLVSDVLINPTEVHCFGLCTSDQSYELRYFGSLHSGRFSALLKISKLVEQFNSEARLPDLKISVYTSTKLTKEENARLEGHGIKVFQPVIGRNYLKRICSAFGLLLIESDREENLRDTWLSCSTKVPEYLSSQRPIVAWGPLKNPSIEEVVENDSCIYLNDNIESLYALFDKRKMADLTARAAATYRTKFSYEVMREKVKE